MDPGSRALESLTIGPVAAGDLVAVLACNQANVPHVGSLDPAGLDHLLAQAHTALVARTADGGFAGFVLALAPGAEYGSPNYQYFASRSDSFLYVDRIAVAAEARRHGVGRVLYRAVFDAARDAGLDRVTCEVNLDPPNPTSAAFHRSLGFVEVGRQWTYDDTVLVALLERPASAGGAGAGATQR